MNLTEELEKLLPSFRRYYNIKREDVTPPFLAEAEFCTHDEQYFLMKSAKLFESESKEYIFFAGEEHLTLSRLNELDTIAWTECLSRVKPGEGHKNTDAALIILAEQIDDDAFGAIKKIRHHKSYCFSIHGWSNYRLIAIELSTGRVVHNRLGQSLKKLMSNIYH